MSSAATPPSSRLSSFARRVRTAPGYRQVTDSLLPRIRGNETVVDLLTRLVGEGGRLGGASHPLVTAKGVDTEGADRWPIVIVTVDDPDGADSPDSTGGAADARGPRPEAVAAVVAEVAALQERLRCFRVVFLVREDAFPAVRGSGHVVEIVPPVEGFADPDDWRRHRARRVVSMTDHYRAWLVMDVPLSERSGLSPAQRELLEALPGYLTDQCALHDLPPLPGVTDG